MIRRPFLRFTLAGAALVAAAIAALAAAVAAAGCGGKSHGGASPTPTGTPSLDVTPVITISGTTTIERGECIGFVLHTTNFDVPPTASVAFGNYELSPSVFLVLDFDSVQVGFPCFYTGLDLPKGPLDVSIIDGTRSVTGHGVFTVVETTQLALGPAPADSLAVAADPDANALGVSHDFDVYEWWAPADGLYLAETIVATSASASFKPYGFVTTTSFAASWDGSDAAIVPATAGQAFFSEISDYHVGGAATGFDYRFAVAPLGLTSNLTAADACGAGASITSAGLYTIDLAGSAPDYNPGGAIACVDPHSPQPPVDGEGVRATGGDRVLRVQIPAGATFEAVARGATTDVVLYLLPDDGTGTDCAAATACLTAADVFGRGDTETLRWKNTTAAPANAWLIVDDYGGTASTPGPVTLLLREE